MQQPPLSPDGNYWWDGARWQPVSAPADPPAEQGRPLFSQAYPRQPQGYGAQAAPAYATPSQAYAQPGYVPAGYAPQPFATMPGGRWARGVRLARISWSVLRETPSLAVLPVLSFGGMVMLLLAFAGVGFGLHLAGGANPVLVYLAVGLYYFAAAFITYFFNAALVAGALVRLQGGTPTLNQSIGIAAARWRQILAWSALTATVGMVLRVVREEFGIVGQVVAALIGIVWSVTTMFVVPILVVEDVSAIGAVKRSAAVLRARWGENLAGSSIMALVLLACTLPAVLVSLVLIAVSPILGIALLLLVVAAYVTIASAISGIFKAALYIFAVHNVVPAGFAGGDLATSFGPKKRTRGRIFS